MAAGGRRNPSAYSFDPLTATRAGAERAKSLKASTGMARSALVRIEPGEITQAFNIWWQYEGSQMDLGPKADNRKAFVRGWKQYAKGERNPSGGVHKFTLSDPDRLRVGDYFRVNTPRLSASGWVTKINRVNVEYKEKYFATRESPDGWMRGLKIRKDELIGAEVVRGVETGGHKENPFVESVVSGMGTGLGLGVAGGLLAPVAVSTARRLGLVGKSKNPFQRIATEDTLKRLSKDGYLLIKFSDIWEASNAQAALEVNAYEVWHDVLKVTPYKRGVAHSKDAYYVVVVPPGNQPSPKEMRSMLREYLGAADKEIRGVRGGSGVLNPCRNPKLSTKDPATMTVSQLNSELDKLDAMSSDLTDRFIESGLGHLGYNELLQMQGPIHDEARAVFSRRGDLSNEIGLRWGPGAPSRLPVKRGWWGPRRKG